MKLMQACKNKKCLVRSICHHAIAGHPERDCGPKKYDDGVLCELCEPCKEQREKK